MGSRTCMARALKHCRKGHARTLSPIATFFQFKPEKGLAMGKLSIVYRKISELKPYPRNARTHSRKQVNQIAASITGFGFTNPVMVDGRGQIIARPARFLSPKLLTSA